MVTYDGFYGKSNNKTITLFSRTSHGDNFLQRGNDKCFNIFWPFFDNFHAHQLTNFPGLLVSLFALLTTLCLDGAIFRWSRRTFKKL